MDPGFSHESDEDVKPDGKEDRNWQRGERVLVHSQQDQRPPKTRQYYQEGGYKAWEAVLRTFCDEDRVEDEIALENRLREGTR